MKEWKLLDQEDVSPSKWFPIERQTIELPNGKQINDFYISKLGDGTGIIPVLPNGKILWLKQYKHGVNEFTSELPGGRVDKNESALETAKRELLEATGYTSESFKELGYVCPVPTKDGGHIHGFVATELTYSGEKHFDITEEIEPVELTVSESKKMIKNGEIYG